MMNEERKPYAIMHKCFIEALGDTELQNKYLRYIYDYACKGIEPTFTDVREISLWNICKSQIDDEQSSVELYKHRK